MKDDTEPLDLDALAVALCDAHDGLVRPDGSAPYHRALPSRTSLIHLVEELRTVLFPGYFGDSEVTGVGRRFHVGATLDRVRRRLQVQIARGLAFACEHDQATCEDPTTAAPRLTDAFLARLPDVRHMLALDVHAAYEGDPASTTPEEPIFSYPGVAAVTIHRLAHELYLLDVPLIPRIIAEYAHSATGIDIHPGASIGESLFIDHGTGVVIGETSRIGKRVRIYQGVTLGAKSFPLDEDGNPIKGIPRHPIVEDDVIIYSGATLLGRITVGSGAVIGGNVWVTRDVPPGARITQATARETRFENGAGI
ncbi:MAG: serine O-acetyltransferase EpsC [Myxococcota bacterium]